MIFQNKINEIYRSNLFRRYDDTGVVYYFSSEDFSGLSASGFPFTSSSGNRLQGYFYSYDSPVPGRIIIFDHGLGGGHRSYLKEIEMLCRHGFLVYSYDHTGCMESQGEGINGLTQSLADLNDCIKAIKKTHEYNGMDISVIGNSWGGFACGNICRYHSDISHIIVMSGFVSVKRILEQNFPGILKLYRQQLMDMEKDANPEFFECDISESLKTTKAKCLLIYSDNDAVVKKAYHYDVLKKALGEKDNIKFLLEHNKGHNPNYTLNAVKQLKNLSEKLSKKIKRELLSTQEQKKEFISSFDWQAITAQDTEVWNHIYETLDQ